MELCLAAKLLMRPLFHLAQVVAGGGNQLSQRDMDSSFERSISMQLS